MNLSKFEGKNIHIIGVSGAEGSAVAQFFGENLKKRNITCHDYCSKRDFKKSFFDYHDSLSQKEKEKALRDFKKLKLKVNHTDDYLRGVEKADYIFVPQSWFRYEENEVLHKIRAKSKFWNITKLYFELFPGKIVGVTGTSGKSTTTKLVYEMLGAAGKNVYFTGNDRKNVQVLDQINEMTSDDFMVIEISNRQLKIDLKKSPYIATITNVVPSHMDDHENYEEYKEVKRSILKYQSREDFAVLNSENSNTRDFSKNNISQNYFFSSKNDLDSGAYVSGGRIVIKDKGREYIVCMINEIQVPGPHNLENILAASMTAYLAGASTKDIRQAITEFEGLESRLEFVKEVRGVKYYEDSSACNPDGTRFAVQSFRQPIVLIAGGTRKQGMPSEFDQMAEAIVKNNVKAVLLIGKKKDEIERAIRAASEKLGQKEYLIKKCDKLDEAVKHASTISKKGDAVVLSPGCESFDMFKDYRDRARKFKRLVNKLG